MNKIIAATMMLMLVACSDNSSVNGPENRQLGGGTAVLDSTRNVSLKMGACNDHPYDNVLLKDASANPKAYLITDENGAYQVVIPKLTDACGVGEVVFNNKRSLDTLILSYTVGVVTDCMCITDHYFNIDPLDADIKFLKHWGTVYDVVPGPIPENQSISDSSATQSASLINAECKNILAKAGESDVNLIPDVLENTTENQKVAIRTAEDDKFDRIYIDDVYVQCGAVFKGIDVTASNDTIYVDPKINLKIDGSGPVPTCLCPTLVSFNIERTSKFSNINYLVYQNDLVMPLENR